jgi:transcriptional regulator of arginine metabolism
MTEKNTRQEVILQIIGRERIGSQEELLSALRKYGISATQATLSRDLRALNVVKQPDADGFVRYQSAQPAAWARNSRLETCILGIEFAGGLGVIRVAPGFASAVAARIDAACLPAVMGTVAGDDTLLLVLREGFGPEAALIQIEDVLPGISR